MGRAREGALPPGAQLLSAEEAVFVEQLAET